MPPAEQTKSVQDKNLFATCRLKSATQINKLVTDELWPSAYCSTADSAVSKGQPRTLPRVCRANTDVINVSGRDLKTIGHWYQLVAVCYVGAVVDDVRVEGCVDVPVVALADLSIKVQIYKNAPK